MTQLRLIFSRSMNPTPSIMNHNNFIERFKTFNKDARIDNLPEISLSDFKERYGYNREINKPFNRRIYYLRNAKYLNNVSV